MEIILKNLQKKIPIPIPRILKAAKTASRRLKISPRVLSIVFAGAKAMRAINKKFLKHDYVTDVLSFELGDDLSEIIICPGQASLNAREHRSSTEDEIILYLVHGLLHLAGYDDHARKDIIKMRRMEKTILKLKGCGSPKIQGE